MSSKKELTMDELTLKEVLIEILEDHPELEKEDILAALQYAKLLSSGKTLKEVTG